MSEYFNGIQGIYARPDAAVHDDNSVFGGSTGNVLIGIFRRKNGNFVPVFLFHCLILLCGKDRSCFPLIRIIAAECGYGISTVKRALNDLEDAGYIKRKVRFDERKRGG